jgi:hypothetical protein
MRLGRVCANPDARAAERLRARLFVPKRRLRATERPRSPLNFTASRLVPGWAVHTRISALVRSSRRRSPMEFTVFGVVADRAIRTRIGVLV